MLDLDLVIQHMKNRIDAQIKQIYNNITAESIKILIQLTTVKIIPRRLHTCVSNHALKLVKKQWLLA